MPFLLLLAATQAVSVDSIVPAGLLYHREVQLTEGSVGEHFESLKVVTSFAFDLDGRSNPGKPTFTLRSLSVTDPSGAWSTADEVTRMAQHPEGLARVVVKAAVGQALAATTESNGKITGLDGFDGVFKQLKAWGVDMKGDNRAAAQDLLRGLLQPLPNLCAAIGDVEGSMAQDEWSAATSLTLDLAGQQVTMDRSYTLFSETDEELNLDVRFRNKSTTPAVLLVEEGSRNSKGRVRLSKPDHIPVLVEASFQYDKPRVGSYDLRCATTVTR